MRYSFKKTLSSARKNPEPFTDDQKDRSRNLVPIDDPEVRDNMLPFVLDLEEVSTRDSSCMCGTCIPIETELSSACYVDPLCSPLSLLSTHFNLP